MNRRFSLKGRTRLRLTENIYKTSSSQISSPPLFFFFICGYVGNILEQKLFECYQFQVWKCILRLGDGSRCALLQGEVEPQTKWESQGPKPFLYWPASEESRFRSWWHPQAISLKLQCTNQRTHLWEAIAWLFRTWPLGERSMFRLGMGEMTQRGRRCQASWPRGRRALTPRSCLPTSLWNPCLKCPLPQ